MASTSTERRVVITGLGVVSPIGNNVDVFWENLIAGKCGVEKITSFDASPFDTGVAAYTARVLRGLGYRARVVIAARPRPYASRSDGARMETSTWFGGELGASDFVAGFFACAGPYGHGWFCDPGVERQTRRATSLAATDPAGAAAAWASADRRLVDEAAAVPLVTPTQVEYVSSRVRNYRYHPIWGLLADQIRLAR